MIIHDLSDLEICKEIADSQAFDYRIQNEKVLPEDPANVITGKLTDVFNPLIDKALCFELIISEDIARTFINTKGWFYHPIGRTSKDEMFSVNALGDNKAACLALVAKHREPSTEE